MLDDLGRARAEEDPRDRPDRAGADHEHVALLPLDVLERLLPALAAPDHGLELPRDRRQVADLVERRPPRRLDLARPIPRPWPRRPRVPTPLVYGGRGRTANEASRSAAPTRAATPAAAITSSSAPSEPPNAAVTRRHAGVRPRPEPSRRHARPGSASCAAAGWSTLPSVTWPAPPAEDEPTTIRRRVVRARPPPAGRPGRSARRGPRTWPGCRRAAAARACSSASCAACCR